MAQILDENFVRSVFVKASHALLDKKLEIKNYPQKVNKSTLDNSLPPLLNLKSLLRPQHQIIDVKCEKLQ